MNDSAIRQKPGARFRRVFGLVAESLRNGEQDFTRGPIERAVVLLAVPMVLEMAMEAIFAITDIFYVARLGADSTLR